MTPYLEANLKRWDESVAIHLRDETGFYGVADFRRGRDVLGPLESAEIGPVAGRRLLHLQCHFGLDTLCLARRGASVTGLDFSPAAIRAARQLAAETGTPATFVEGPVDAAPALVGGGYDLVYVSWGAICWLPDIRRWAQVVAEVLAPGGEVYLLDGHPAAQMLEQDADGRLVATYPYFHGPEPLVWDEATTYTGDPTRLANTTSYEWQHPVSAVITAVVAAGLRLETFREHDALAWPLFPCMVADDSGLHRLPAGHPTVPLAFTIRARKPG